MKCLLCKNKCDKYSGKLRTIYQCNNCISDVSHEISKYNIVFTKSPIRLESRTLWLDDLYIQLDYINKCTVVSRIDGYFLCNTVQINKLLSLDSNNPYDIMDKIRTLLLFS